MGNGRWLIVNDSFGALAVAFAGRDLVSWSDSSVSIKAAEANLARNDVDPGTVTFVPSTETPPGPVDLAIVKVPRTLAFLEDELRRLRPLLHDASMVIGAGMTRAVHRSTIAAFETTIGPTPTSLARKKARLLLPSLDPSLPSAPRVEPGTWVTAEGITVFDLPNVFSSGGLDAGTRLLLDHLPPVPPGHTVVDLGCGNGVVAATIAHRNADIALVCCDESHHAVAAARRTLGVAGVEASLHVADVLDGVSDSSADLVVVNPPFHAGGARTTDVAHRMFREARRVLRPGGEIRVVGNRHLGHHVALGRCFSEVEVVASDPGFVVLRAVRES